MCREEYRIGEVFEFTGYAARIDCNDFPNRIVRVMPLVTINEFRKTLRIGSRFPRRGFLNRTL